MWTAAARRGEPLLTSALLAVALSWGASGCDDGAVTGVVASVEPDAGECFLYRVEVLDWSSGIPVPPLTVTAEGEGLATTSAPNGRAVLCLALGTRHRVRFEGAGHVVRVEVVTAEDYLATVSDSELAYPVYMLTRGDLDGLSDLATTADTAQVFVDLRAAGHPAADLTPTLDPDMSSAALIGSPRGAFTPGTITTDLDSIVHFRDVPAGRVSLDPGSRELCGPALDVTLVADEITGALIDCSGPPSKSPVGTPGRIR